MTSVSLNFTSVDPGSIAVEDMTEEAVFELGNVMVKDDKELPGGLMLFGLGDVSLNQLAYLFWDVAARIKISISVFFSSCSTDPSPVQLS